MAKRKNNDNTFEIVKKTKVEEDEKLKLNSNVNEKVQNKGKKNNKNNKNNKKNKNSKKNGKKENIKSDEKVSNNNRIYKIKNY